MEDNKIPTFGLLLRLEGGATKGIKGSNKHPGLNWREVTKVPTNVLAWIGGFKSPTYGSLGIWRGRALSSGLSVAVLGGSCFLPGNVRAPSVQECVSLPVAPTVLLL